MGAQRPTHAQRISADPMTSRLATSELNSMFAVMGHQKFRPHSLFYVLLLTAENTASVMFSWSSETLTSRSELEMELLKMDMLEIL